MKRQIAQAVKDYLVQLAVDDKLPIDLTELEVGGIESVIADAISRFDDENPTCCGFSVDDVIQHGNQNGKSISIEDAKEIIGYMNNKAEQPVGWETLEYFTDCYLEEKNENKV